MTQQTWALGAGTLSLSDNVLTIPFPAGDAGRIDADLVDGGGDAFARSLVLATDAGSSVTGETVNFYISDAGSGSGAGTGPDLTAQMEANGTITIEAGGNTLVLTGIGDAAEPYLWTPANQAEVAAFIAAYVSGSAVTVTLDDHFTPLALSDIAVPAGRRLVGTGSLIRVGASGDVYNTDATVLDGADPPNAGALAPTRIYVTGAIQLRISVTTGGNIEAEWSAGGALENHQLHVQTST